VPNKLFLETYPLFRRFKGFFNGYMNQLPKVTVHMECEKCKSPQTFGMVTQTAATKSSTRTFSDSMRKLLEKKSTQST